MLEVTQLGRGRAEIEIQVFLSLGPRASGYSQPEVPAVLLLALDGECPPVPHLFTHGGQFHREETVGLGWRGVSFLAL